MKKYLFFFLIFSSLIHADLYVVTSLDDDGMGTLREAMSVLVDGDSIEFDIDPMLLPGTISLASSLPALSESLVVSVTISGPSDNSISIDGNSLYRIFDVRTYSNLNVDHLNLLNGADSSLGGAVCLHTGATATLTNVSITPGSGGNAINPITVTTNGNLNLIDVLFTSSDASQIFLDGCGAAITSTIPCAFVIDAINSTTIYKYGAAVTSVSSPDMITPDYSFIAIEGPLNFIGSLLGSLNAFPGGSIYGNFSTLSVTNYLGLVRAGDFNTTTFGEMSMTTDYLDVYGTTQTRIDSSGNTDLIHAFGAYILSGSLSIIPESGTYVEGTKYQFLTTDDGGDSIYGTFDSVDAGGLDVQINYNLTSIEIEILTTTTI